jgi:pyruvate ferredoxin oxidoreductase alpha subunit
MQVNKMKQMLDGNGAATEALKLAKVDVIAAYPITPQSPIAEKLSQYAIDGTMNTRYIRIESEHSALSCAIGAQLTGVRASTATSSVGLALMHEVLGVASGCRVPIVMPVVNRALVSPWSLWCDHQDSMSERDSGWLQFYAENAQEVLDLLIIAYRAAEHEHVLLPAMVCLDGFFLSHSLQVVDVPEQKTVDQFLPKYESKNLYLDPGDPMFINNLTSPGDFSEMRFQQKTAFENALKVIPEVQEEFLSTFARRLEMVECYRSEDADIVLVTIGSMSGTAKHVINKMRKAGHKVGVIKITTFRPFPVEKVAEALKGKKFIGVIDRSAGLGAQGGPLWLEVTAALEDKNAPIYGYVAGLGGRDITEKTIEQIFHQGARVRDGGVSSVKSWIDTREEAMDIRCVETG